MAVIEAIATQYLEADAATVTFSGIPATYEHLQLRASVRSTETVYAMRLKINLLQQPFSAWNRLVTYWVCRNRGGAH